MKSWIVAVLCLSLAGRAAAQVPGVVNYQGRVRSQQTPFTGTGQFRFALVQPGPTNSLTTLWSQDGSDVPTSIVSIPIHAGLFTVALGDTNVLGMELPIPPAVFDSPNVHLRVWFNDGTSGFDLLKPDQRLTSVGYALRADNVRDGAITGAKIANGSIGPHEIGDGAITSPKLAGGAVTALKLADGSVTTEKIAANAITGSKVAPNSLTSDDIAATLRLRDLQIESEGGLDRVQLTEENNSGALYLLHGTIGKFLEASGTTDGGFLRLYEAFGGLGLAQTTVELGSSSVGGYGRFLQDNQGTGVMIQGQSGATAGGAILVYQETGLGLTLQGSTGQGQGSLLNLYNGQGNRTLALDGDASGRGGSLAIFNGAEALSVLVDGDSGGAGLIEVRNASGQARAALVGQDASGGGRLLLRDEDGTATVLIEAAEGPGNGAQIALHKGAGGNPTILLDADRNGEGRITTQMLEITGSIASGGGELLLRDEDGTATVLIEAAEGPGNGAQIALYKGAGGNPTIVLDADRNGEGRITTQMLEITGSIASGGGELLLRDEDGTATVQIEAAEGPGNGAQIALYKGAGGNPTIVLDADKNGEGRITTQVLEITGGSDLSETFEIQSPDAKPGMIVSIDPVHPGELAVSTRPYDRTVAGVVSGAGGVNPGMLMGQRGSRADGRHPVALTGRVYCLVDASQGAVAPGDLITTSSTPGHGMKVADPTQAHGAIIGKAMTGLNQGRGLVLLLVSLQ